VSVEGAVLLLPNSLFLTHTRTVNCGRMPPRSVLAKPPTPAVLVIACGVMKLKEGEEGGREEVGLDACATKAMRVLCVVDAASVPASCVVYGGREGGDDGSGHMVTGQAKQRQRHLTTRPKRNKILFFFSTPK